MNEREKALNDKVKRFDRWLIGLLVNIAVSCVTTLILLTIAGVL